MSNYCIFFSQKNTIFEDVTLNSFKNEINKKFLLYLPIFLNFQLSYFSNFKKIADMESLFITLLCALNTTSHIKKKNSSNNKVFNSSDIFAQLPKLKDQYGLNSTSIAEITKLPRTTVLRKLAKLENLSLLKKDEFKRYATPEQAKKEYYPTIQHTLKLLGIFISECLEVYTVKDLKVS